jgi:ribosomal protein L21E
MSKHSQDHSAKPHSHYFKDVSQLNTIDVYRVIDLYNIDDPCIQHAVKKLLVAGGRGAGKDANKDIQEAIDSLERWKDMRQEDNPIFNRRSTDKIPEVEFPEVGEPEEIKNTGKFKIGDLVICQGLEEVYIPAEFNGKVGKVIDNTDFDYTVEFNEKDAACNVWCIWEKLMRPYVEPKRRFGIGDKVKIVGQPSYIPENYVNTVGEIAMVYEPGQESEHYKVITYDNDHWFFDSNEIRHV